jgi:hypothetical protein
VTNIADDKLGRLFQKSNGQFCERFEISRLNRDLEVAKTATFALLECARDVRRKCKTPNRELAWSYEIVAGEFRRTGGAKFTHDVRCRRRLPTPNARRWTIHSAFLRRRESPPTRSRCRLPGGNLGAYSNHIQVPLGKRDLLSLPPLAVPLAMPVLPRS